jgi:beta-lactamase regulating signal transducer with metallopeptidase domain
MATLFDFLSDWSCRNLGLILNGIWLGLILTGLVWLVLRRNLNMAASSRYLVWWASLVAVLALPWLTTLSWNNLSSVHKVMPAPQGNLVDKALSASPDWLATAEYSQPAEPITAMPPSDRQSPIVPHNSTASVWNSITLRWIPLAFTGVWLVIMLLCLYRLWGTHRSIVRIKALSRPFNLRSIPNLQQRLETVGREPVAVRLSSEIATPMAAGLGKPTILIPDKVASALSPSDLEVIILHELAHLTRWDDWTKLAQKLIEAVFFFHPAVHLISRQLDLERELACDEWAVAQSGQVERYACSLTRLVQLTNGGITSLIPGALTGRKQIFKRFERLLLYLPTKPLRRPRLTTAGLAIGVLTAALLLAGIAPAVTLPFKPLTLAQLGGTPAGTSQPSQDRVSDTVSDSTAKTVGDTDVVSSVAPSTSTTISDTDIEQLLTTLNLSPEFTFEADWEAEFKRGRPWLNFTFYYDRDSRSSFSLPVDDFIGIDESWRTERADDVRFLLMRGAGVFDFRGGFKRGLGDGEFVFRVSEDYLRELDEMGYRVRHLNDFELFKLALFDVSGTFIKEMEELGYKGLSLDRLIEMRIHGVKTETVRELRDLGYDVSADRLVEFQIHGVTPWFIEELVDAGLKNLSAERLVEFRIHGVEADQVTEFRELGLSRLSADDLVKFRIHRVTPDFVRDLQKQGYGNLSPDRLVEFRIHSVSPSMIDELRELGYNDLTPDELKSFSIHGVTPDFIRDLRKLGYDRVSPDDLISMRIHGVTPSYIKRMAKRGYNDLSVEDLIEFRIHGID